MEKFIPIALLAYILFNCPNQLTFTPLYFVTTICTVLLLTPNLFAAWRTVAFSSIM